MGKRQPTHEDFHYPEWADGVRLAGYRSRQIICQQVMDKHPSLKRDDAYGVSALIPYWPLGGGDEHCIVFKESALLTHPNKLPMLVWVQRKPLFEACGPVDTHDAFSMIRCPEWHFSFSATTPSQRKEWVASCLAGLRSYQGSRPRKSGVWLSDILEERFTPVGITRLCSYYRLSGSAQEECAEYVHPYGTPTVLWMGNEGKQFCAVNPSLRLDDSVLQEVGNRLGYGIQGITG